MVGKEKNILSYAILEVRGWKLEVRKIFFQPPTSNIQPLEWSDYNVNS